MLEEYERLLDRQIQRISMAEGKASTILAITAAMLGSLLAVASRFAGTASELALSITSLVVTLLLFSLLSLALSTFPRIRGTSIKSMYFFHDISAISATEFSNKLKQATTDEKLDDLALQIHRNSVIATEKYRWLTRAMLSLFLSSLPWATALYLLVKI
ncbi:Pycsar system effector family protein [Granulosicoccus antarcticus]|uniref:Pycsar effector protein domain-containing protein n=1 Tax=Granulosicoccus antarcticus IMCC3135 TaxID=1192854 RepID=A0A2Z2NLK3_9GAMM|nr:Pycsar system effector family protein [Granulosicoccus antarcticus]ASJ72039.1 hypothetical protein IMCC3135_09715 [Granulosicoccus antarcticus IMCC3135]